MKMGLLLKMPKNGQKSIQKKYYGKILAKLYLIPEVFGIAFHINLVKES